MSKHTAPVIADDFTTAQIAEHRDRALDNIRAAGNLFPGMVRLHAGDRTGNLGRLVIQLASPLRLLFAAITPGPDDDAQAKKNKAELAAIFDKMLGAQDRGKDDGRFEAELLARRLDRAEAEQAILEALDELRARFADDLLNTGDMVISPGLLALDVARTAAAANPTFKSLLAPTLNALGEMTKKARRNQEAAKKAAQNATGEPAGSKGEDR